jgi:putative NADPH-quinone reductase
VCHGRLAVRLVDQSGNMLHLCYDTRQHFAYWVALNQPASLKRYQIDRVYRRGISHSAPREYFQVSPHCLQWTMFMCQKGPAYIFVAIELIFHRFRVFCSVYAKFCNHSAEKRGFSMEEQQVFSICLL